MNSALSPRSLKQFIRYLVTLKPINRVVVALLMRLPPSAWKQRIPVVDKEAILDLGEDCVLRLGHADKCQVALDLFWNRGTFGSPADRLALNVAVSFSRQAAVFIDIGAYSGVFALAAGKVNPDIRSYAYEILPENFLILYQNVFLNNLALRVHPRLCGLSDCAGKMRLPREVKRGALPSSVALDWTFDDGVDVPLKTLDDLHAEVNGPVVMKIDVEGFETEVLEGGRALLERARPDIVCEVLRRAPRISDLQDLLRPLGYRFFHITEDGLVQREKIEPIKTERDWFFSTRDADEIRTFGLNVNKSE